MRGSSLKINIVLKKTLYAHQHKRNYYLSVENVLTKLQANPTGLTQNEVVKRQKIYGLNIIHKRKVNFLTILVRSIKENPLIIVLTIATFVSFLLGQRVSAYYIFGMIIVSIILDVWNEYSAEKTIENLLKKISPTALVVRNNEKQEIPVSELTIGDIVLLSQGSIIPADLRLLESNNIEINESTLTGEAKTVYKTSTALTHEVSGISEMKNIAFMGTIVSSGSGKGVVIRIGRETEFGKIAQTTTFLKPVTEFQKGLSSYGRLIVKVIFVLTAAIFFINAGLGRNIIDSLLFALAIAVGLTPEMLPVIVTVSLAHGASKLAKHHVIAKQLIAVENLGNMDILCTDKTGTLTEGKIQVMDYIDMQDKRNNDLIQLALYCNSALVHHKIIGNGIDVALWEYAQKEGIVCDLKVKLKEEPFDYNRKLMYTVLDEGEKATLIVKGAPETVIALCPNVTDKKRAHDKYIALTQDGLRVIAVASKVIAKKDSYSWDDVHALTFHGFITMLDVPKKSAKEALDKLKILGVQIKVITGDSDIITQKVCREVGMGVTGVLTGSEMEKLSDTEFSEIVEKTTIFARVSPEQKLKVIQTLQSKGHAVGYLGDGINDIPSLHSADVGISVNSAVDVAKDAATLVLLRKSLDVIAEGIMEGRRTFHNTVKYILMGTSSNFGNMFSAAGASFFLPFLPMTSIQILLNNSLYDASQLAIPTDSVDPEALRKPKHWNISFIQKYMLFFGPLSSAFDVITFVILIFIFKANAAFFQTGWFMVSFAMQILVVFVIRTARTPFYRSRPGKWLTVACLSMLGIGLALPYTPLAKPLGFIPMPPLFILLLILITATYVLLVSTVRSIFLKRYSL